MTGNRQVSRREYLGAFGVATAAGIAGCTGDDDTDNGDPGTGDDEAQYSPSSLPPRERTFQVGPDGGGIDFDPIVEIGQDHTPEGLAYRDGHFYTGQREGPAWIREYTRDGELTDDRFEFEDVAINHTNTMDWVDGELWVADSNTSTTYCIDWEEKEIVQEIEHSDPAPGTWRAVVPTKTGEKKLLFCEWLGRHAWIVDLQGAREDGVTGDHFEKTLRNGFWTNPQTMEWVDGALYTTTHEWIIKSRLPYADQIPEGAPVTSYDIEWAYEFEDHDTLEQLMYNPDHDEFILVDRGGVGTIYRGRETYGIHRNQSFSRWDTREGGPNGEQVIDMNDSGMGRLMFTNGFGEGKVGWVEVWFRPVAVDTAAGAGVQTTTNDLYALGVWSEASDDHLAWHDGEEWTATDVELPEDGWIKFGYEVREDAITGYLSTSYGNAWDEVAHDTGADMVINSIGIEQQSGRADVGHWKLELSTANVI